MGGGGGLSGLKFQRGAGSLENLDKNLLFEVSVQKPACASQIVSHIPRMWRLIKKMLTCFLVNFCPNSPESPFLEFQTRKPPPPWKTSDLRWPKFTLEYPPMKNFRFEMFTLEYPPKWNTSDLRWPKFTPEYPPKWKTSDLRWPKFTLEYPPPPKWKTSDLRWPKFTPEYPPKMKNFRFEMTKVFPEYPPKMKNFRFEMTKVYSGIPPPQMKNFRFEMTKVYSGILRNTPPPEACNLGDRMWRLICIPRGYHSFKYLDQKHVCFGLSEKMFFCSCVLCLISENADFLRKCSFVPTFSAWFLKMWKVLEWNWNRM